MTSSVTILLLDDEPLLRRATALLLARRGGQVTAAASADEAVVLARRHLYDVAVFDVSPPGPSASDLLRRIRREGLPPRRVIAVSRAPLSGRDAEGLTAVLVAPYAWESLERAVFGAGERQRTQSGVFPLSDRHPLREAVDGITVTGSRVAARAGRGRGG
jgi:CheY-like chemotaxis protein